MTSFDRSSCPVCTKEQAETRATDFDGAHQVCPRCGEFKLSGTAGAMLRGDVGPVKQAILSGWVREQNYTGSVPMITSTVLKNVLARSIPTVGERAFALLREAEHGLTVLGETFNVTEPRFLASTYSADSDDIYFLVRALKDEGLMDFHSSGGLCEILPRGYMRLDEQRRSAPASTHGFVAMWFDKSLDEAFEHGLQAGVLDAGYDALRVDRIEHVNRIDDEIIRQIHASRFLVADFTGHRGGVYFEAGYALGKGIPVFWTCRTSDLDSLHFDIRQFNCIGWDDTGDLATRLANRIVAVLGPGPNKSTDR